MATGAAFRVYNLDAGDIGTARTDVHVNGLDQLQGEVDNVAITSHDVVCCGNASAV